MCGIAGAYRFNKSGSLKSQNIDKALKLIEHRGPDDTKSRIVNNNFCAGSVRLSIEALNSGAQPLTIENLTVGFNGEIFNYKELAKSYRLEGLATSSEVHFLLHAWQKKSFDLFEDLDGQFAIFIYDSSKDELILARDPFGIRPLFYALHDGGFYFCSEIKGIFKLSSNDFAFDEIGIAEIAMLWTTIGDRTVFENIKQIKRGHYASISSKGISQSSYYNEPLLSENRREFSSKDEASEFLRASLEASVNSQIHGEVGYASYLSGGIDSSALAYYLNKKTCNSKLNTFSIKFESEEYDESLAQGIVNQALDVNNKSILASKSDIASNFRSTIDHAETLLFRTAPVPLYLLSKEVKNSGYKVVYTGEGADEILLGYDLFAESRIRRFWSRSPDSNWRPNLLKRLYSYLPQFNNSRYFSIIRDFYQNSITETDSIFYSHLIRWSQFKQVSSFFNLNRTDSEIEEEIFRDINTSLPKSFNGVTSDRKAQILEFETLLHGYLLSSQGDRMSMAHSVEGRYPFLGKNFVKDMAEISDYQKTSGVRSKDLFREAMKGSLPAEIVSRPKVAYQAPEAKCFLSSSHITEEAMFLNDNCRSSSFICDESLMALNSKITNQFSSERLGFRENMAYIMCMSLVQLADIKKSWSL
tara:strand:- start:2771 stop:4699 length:1929 start_codon:yes stop_codon:yes gene_type:complete